MNFFHGFCADGALIPEADKAAIAGRLACACVLPQERSLLATVGAARDVAWFALSQSDDQGSRPTCTVQSCLDVVEFAWRQKGVAVPNLHGVAAYDWARAKYHAGEAAGGLYQHEAFAGAVATELFPQGTHWEVVSGLDAERNAMTVLPLIDVEAVTEAWSPQYVNRSNGYFDPSVAPRIVGYHSNVRLAMLFEGENCWHAKHVHWGRRQGVNGVMLYHRAAWAKFGQSSWVVRFPHGYESHDGWRLHL